MNNHIKRDLAIAFFSGIPAAMLILYLASLIASSI
jgi:hypothetical protein